MAQHRARAACEDGRRELPTPADLRVPDGVDTTVYPAKTAGAESVLDRSPPKPQRDELPIRDHPVLAFGEARDPLVNWPLFTIYFMVKSNQLSHIGQRRSRRQTVGLRT